MHRICRPEIKSEFRSEGIFRTPPSQSATVPYQRVCFAVSCVGRCETGSFEIKTKAKHIVWKRKKCIKKGIYTVTANEPLTPSVWRMTLEGDTQYLTRPGQFVNIEVEGLYLRRPISVCDYNERTLTLIYKVVGEGTARLSEMKTGEKLDLLTGLGNEVRSGYGVPQACWSEAEWAFRPSTTWPRN